MSIEPRPLKAWQKVLVIALTILIGVSLLISISNGYSERHVYVGAYYYVWYEKDSWTEVIDNPVLDYYGSENHTIIKEHLDLIERLGIDFLILSYNPWTQTHISYNNTPHVFEVAKELDSNIKLCLIVESDPLNESLNDYNFTLVHDLIYEEYTIQSHYFNWQGKPLLLYYNAKNMTEITGVQEDNRFIQKILGHEGYVDWVYVTHYEGNWLGKFDERNPSDRHICVSPAYSDVHFRDPNWTCDVDYSKGYYQKEWDYALEEVCKNTTDLITIASWNEFPERTAIEPHIRNGCNFSSSYAYDLTQDYLEKLRAIEEVEAPRVWYEDATTVLALILSVFIGYFLIKRLLLKYKKTRSILTLVIILCLICG